MAFHKNFDKGKTAHGAAAVTHGPTTAAQWSDRVAQLEGDVAAAEQALILKRTERRSTAGNVIVFGSASDELSKLETEERELERRLDSQRAAVEVAKAERGKAEAVEEQSRQEGLRLQRAALAAKIQTHAAEVDKAFAHAASQLQTIQELLRELGNLGSGFHRSLKGCVTRGAYAAGLREYLEPGFVGGPHHLQPLARQFHFLSPPSADNPLAEVAAEPEAKTA